MIETIVSVKGLFLDRPEVIRRIGQKKARVLKRFGAAVRLVAQRSMRRTKKPSPPGSPPAVKKGLLRRHIYFALDRSNDSVVIGPVLLFPGSPVPALHEYGGIRRSGAETNRYPERPYMRPAFETILPRLESYFREAEV